MIDWVWQEFVSQWKSTPEHNTEKRAFIKNMAVQHVSKRDGIAMDVAASAVPLLLLICASSPPRERSHIKQLTLEEQQLVERDFEERCAE